MSPAAIMRALNSDELTLLGALFERLFPTDELGPGAIEIGVLEYVQTALSGPYGRLLPAYRAGVGRARPRGARAVEGRICRAGLGSPGCHR